MTAKIWELHAWRFEGEIRTTREGDAEVAGLVISEKAYLLAVRDFRPSELIRMVKEHGIQGATAALAAHYATPTVLQSNGGRALIAARGHSVDPMVRRNDEVSEPLATGRQERANS